MTSNDIKYIEITDASDPLWQAWKAIYLSSFPIHERMSEAHFIDMLDAKSEGKSQNKHMMAMVSEYNGSDLLGIAYYETKTEFDVALLWYLAITENERSRGYGPLFYGEILRRARQEGAKLLIFEVEMADTAVEGTDPDEWARRRIEWYRRQGAFLLEGIAYLQSVDTGVPPTQMHLMVHPFGPVTPEQAFTLAKALFGDALQQTGELRLL